MSTQKTAWLIVASCCLLLFTSGGLAQAWEVDREIDPITDEKNVTASLRGQVVGTIVDGLTLDDLPGVTSEIHISCKTIGFYPSKDFYLFLAVAPPPLLLDAKPGRPENILRTWSVGDRDVILRFDSEEPTTERWKWQESDYLGFSSFVSPRRGRAQYGFLERLATGAHRQLAVRSMLHDVTWTALFDISKAAPVAQEVLTVCPESDSGSVP